jgi:uncharacterized protein
MRRKALGVTQRPFSTLILTVINHSNPLCPVIKLEEIESYAQNIAEKFEPRKIILFGSYADNTAGEDSDVDLLVIMPHKGKASRQALSIRRDIAKNFPLDLVVQSPHEAERRVNAGDPFTVNALQQGRVLYDVD